MSDDLSKLTGEMYRHWEKSMSAWWDKVLDSPDFLGALGQNVEAQAKARKAWETQVDRAMGEMHLPSRSDVVRLARVASLLEDRLLSLEDRLLAVQDQLGRIEKEALQARIDAAEARLDVQERLAAIEARLAPGAAPGADDAEPPRAEDRRSPSRGAPAGRKAPKA